jgi:addiction module HigA family antidote
MDEHRTPQRGAPHSDRPVHPGFYVRRDLLLPSGMSERAFAQRVGLSLRTLNEIVCEKRPITVETAKKLARFDPRTDYETWIARQHLYDRWKRHQEEGVSTAPS